MIKYENLSKFGESSMLTQHKKTLFSLLLLLITFINAQELEQTKISKQHFSDFSSIVNSFMNQNSQPKEKTNLAGKQRMLTQRMTKLTLLIDADIKSEKNIKKLHKAITLYEENLKILHSKDPKITQQIQIIKKLWKPFSTNIKNVILNKKGIDYIITHNEILLKESNNLVKLYETSNATLNYLDKARLYIVNLAGRQRMLLEKMSKEKILVFQEKKGYKKKLKNSMDEFELALKKLREGDSQKFIPTVSNPKLIQKLNIIEPLWKQLKPLYKKEKLSKKELSSLILQTNLLLLESNIYVKLTEIEIEY